MMMMMLMMVMDNCDGTREMSLKALMDKNSTRNVPVSEQFF